MAIFNEITLFSNGIGFLLFWTLVVSDYQNSIGWVLIALIAANYISNILYLWVLQIIKLVGLIIKLIWICKKKYNDRKTKQMMKSIDDISMDKMKTTIRILKQGEWFTSTSFSKSLNKTENEDA